LLATTSQFFSLQVFHINLFSLTQQCFFAWLAFSSGEDLELSSLTQCSVELVILRSITSFLPSPFHHKVWGWLYYCVVHFIGSKFFSAAHFLYENIVLIFFSFYFMIFTFTYMRFVFAVICINWMSVDYTSCLFPGSSIFVFLWINQFWSEYNIYKTHLDLLQNVVYGYNLTENGLQLPFPNFLVNLGTNNLLYKFNWIFNFIP
jgi:hypothetical protein